RLWTLPVASVASNLMRMAFRHEVAGSAEPLANYVMTDPFMAVHRVEVISLAARYRLPAAYAYRYYAEAGGLLSYGNDLNDNSRRAAIYADRILKGIKPSELPVQAPVKFELVVNAKTAKALGLEIPPSFYWRADEIIEQARNGALCRTGRVAEADSDLHRRS